jgi:hypothetical protein
VHKAVIQKMVLAVLFTSLATFFCSAQATGGKNATGDAQARIAGTWRGNSVCAVQNSPCHDEINVYRFSEIAGKPGIFSVAGSKVVDGKEIVMGTGEWRYDAENHALQSENSVGTFRLIVQGNKMEGNLTLRDHTVYRLIHLTRQN